VLADFWLRSCPYAMSVHANIRMIFNRLHPISVHIKITNNPNTIHKHICKLPGILPEPSLQTSLERYLSITLLKLSILTKFSLFFELFQEHETKVFHEHYFFILTMNIEIVIVTLAVMLLHPLFQIFQVFIETLTYICSVCVFCAHVCMYVWARLFVYSLHSVHLRLIQIRSTSFRHDTCVSVWSGC
jgi:hypothetical protein